LAIAVGGNQTAVPCGICRQFLAEFGTDLKLILANEDGEMVETSLDEYLPSAFTPKHLFKGRDM
jgi:cytidine deaminase